MWTIMEKNYDLKPKIRKLQKNTKREKCQQLRGKKNYIKANYV